MSRIQSLVLSLALAATACSAPARDVSPTPTGPNLPTHLLCETPHPAGSPAVPTSRTPAPPSTSSWRATLDRSRVQPGEVGSLWLANACSPTDDAIRAYSPGADVIVLNAWDLRQKAQIRELNPTAILLVYKDLASARSYEGASVDGEDAGLLPTGVGYHESLRQGWIATDRRGRPIEWNGFDNHWQLKIWESAFQKEWTRSVTREVTANDWDGVFADNQMATLKWYSSSLLNGSTTAAASDALLRRALDSLVGQAGRSLNSQGKLLVPNLSDGRFDLRRWRASARYGGAMDEHFVGWSSEDSRGFVPATGVGGWVDQTSELVAPLTLVHTTLGDDQRVARFSRGSALVRAKGRVVWTMSSSTVPGAGIIARPWPAMDIGRPLGAGEQSGQIWFRRFEQATIVVNPTNALVPALVDGQTVTLPPHDATVLHRP